MNSDVFSAPWHAQSYTRFVEERLPQLLAERVPLRGYRAEPAGPAYRVAVTLGDRERSARVEYQLPRPDERGVFMIDGAPIIVLPIASHEDLATAEIRCAGEQLYDYLAERLGEAPAYLRWDEELARAWLPLDTWVVGFLTTIDPAYRGSTILDQTNWLAERTNLRRIVVDRPGSLFAPGQIGRTCPFEVPEGPNMGRIFSVAVGASIRDGRLVIEDERPEATLGLSASMIPFIEHNDVARTLMGANMLRQWMTPPDPEPALVQTGSEPGEPQFWCGRNLLTAFVSWDADTFEDGIVISASCARRLGYPTAVEPGDKLSNRHGVKGVVSRILPDAEMPHLEDGMPVELICSFMSIPSRLMVGQLREAALSHVARRQGQPVIVPAFHAPDEGALREQLGAAGLPDDGLLQLSIGRDGPRLAQRAPAGWVYWGKLIHTARPKLRAYTGADLEPGGRLLRRKDGLPQGELEFCSLLEAGAIETIREQFNTRAARRLDAATLDERLAHGLVQPADAPTPMFADLARRLQAAGIHAALEDGGLRFSFERPENPAAQTLQLAAALAHPWLPERVIDAVGALPELPSYQALADSNARLAQLLESGAPQALVGRAQAQLQQALQLYLSAVLEPSQAWFGERVLWSARAVIAPGGEQLRYDQVGLPDEVAWQLFGPLAAGVGEDELASRTERAALALDQAMARSWVVVNRAPSVAGHSFLAFRPVRVPGPAVRLASLGCNLLDADFDGDQVALFVPVSEAGQHEAGEKLTIAAHLRRNPELIMEPRPRMDALLGLARLSLEDAGRGEIDQLAGTPVAAPNGFITARTVVDAMRVVMERDGAEAALDAGERLLRRGFEVARQSGMSMGPFVGYSLQRPATPEGDDREAWERAGEALAERITAVSDYHDPDLGALVLACKSQARSNRNQLMRLLGAPGFVQGTSGQSALVRHGYRDGLLPHELFQLVAIARPAIQALVGQYEQLAQELRQRTAPRGYGVLARAMRSRQPGVVFALAADARETDSLTDAISRLFVGLAPLPPV
jgi:hypothetical protein